MNNKELKDELKELRKTKDDELGFSALNGAVPGAGNFALIESWEKKERIKEIEKELKSRGESIGDVDNDW